MPAAVWAASSCTSKNKEDAYPAIITACDTQAVSYKTDVVPVIKPNCNSCHDSANYEALGGSRRLDWHEGLSEEADFNLLPYIQLQPGQDNFMPKDGARLSECQINTIKAWVNQGKKDN
ncbi:MAG: hypothetical protein V4543_05950 [Bacteroidota bacterium]